MDVEVDTLPDLRLATVTHIGPYNLIGAAFGKLGGIAGGAGLFAFPDTMMLAVYPQDLEATPEAELRSHAGITIPEGVAVPDGLQELRVAGGRYARATHIGTFDKLGAAWSRFISEAVPASGYRRKDGPALEIYRSDMRTAPPEELRTDLLVAVE